MVLRHVNSLSLVKLIWCPTRDYLRTNALRSWSRLVERCTSFIAFLLHQRRHIVRESPVPGFLELTAGPPISQPRATPSHTTLVCQTRGFHPQPLCAPIPLHYVTPTNHDVLGGAGYIASHTGKIEPEGHKNSSGIKGLAILCRIRP